MEKTAASDTDSFAIHMHRFEGVVEVIRELGCRKEFNEWLKEQAEIKKQLDELPKSFKHIDKSLIRGETEKAYKMYVGNNGKISRVLYKAFYKWIPKSVCKIIDGEVYAPFWAIN